MLKKLIKSTLHKFGYKIEKISKNLNIVEKNDYESSLFNKIKKFTLTTDENIWLLIQSFKYIIRNNINGDFVECGVWKGGNLILLGELCSKFKLEKNIFGFDTFEGMTEPHEQDKNFANKSAKELLSKYSHKKKEDKNIWAYSSIEDTKKNIKESTSYEKIKLIKGDVKDTLNIKSNLPEKISLLRLDTDFYESTKIELEILYPLLSKGGILIIDDYGHWKGCKLAVEEYFKSKSSEMFFCDFSCRFMIKTED